MVVFMMHFAGTCVQNVLIRISGNVLTQSHIFSIEVRAFLQSATYMEYF